VVEVSAGQHVHGDGADEVGKRGGSHAEKSR
jgi:hypothetical protein